jgi:prepilin-type N-terminal cleavage/methylation domain-containing protein
MNRYVNRKSAGLHDGEQVDEGFTLIEILIAIVLVGILSAVVVLGISNLTSKGSKSACAASADAAKTGAVVYFTDNNAYPDTLAEMVAPNTDGSAPALVLPAGVKISADGSHTTGASWTMTIVAGEGDAAPTFECSNKTSADDTGSVA